MDFYLNPRSDTSQNSSALTLLRALDLNVAAYLHVESSDSADHNSGTPYSNVRALKEIHAVLQNVQTVAATILDGLDTADWSSKTVRSTNT